MRIHVVDPSAYTPPYDHALCRALADAGAEVALYTSRFAHGSTATAVGYDRHELFYRLAGLVPGARSRRVIKLLEHVPDMLHYRRVARGADVVHFQWLTVQHVDAWLLPRSRRAAVTGPALVLTAHDILPREARPGQRAAQRRLYDRFAAIVVHSEHGRARLVEELGVCAERVHVIPHGALDHLTTGPVAEPPFVIDAPVVLFFGLLRPYKGLDVLLEAWRSVTGAQLWIVGMPRMDIGPLRAAAPSSVHFLPRFVTDAELRACFDAAQLVVLPYREIDQSGVVFTALAFAKPLLLSDAGGFGELAAAGAARTVRSGDAGALARELIELLGDRPAREAMAERARLLAAGPYAWENIAGRTLGLYESLLGEDPRR